MGNLAGMYLFMFILSETVCLFTGVLLSILPHITRKSLLFGVRIPDSANKDKSVIQLKTTYSIFVITAMVLVLLVGLYFYYFLPQSMFLLTLYQPLLLLTAQFLTFIPLWKKSVRLKADKGWVVRNIGTSQTASASGKSRMKGMPWIWYIICAALCILSIFAGLAVYPSVPDTIVTHWNGNMIADAWGHKSLIDIFIMPIIAFSTILLMFGSNILIYFMKLQVSLENPVLSYAQHKLYRRIMSHMLGFITLVMTIMFLAMMPMNLNLYVPTMPVLLGGIFVLTLLILIPAVLVSAKVGQGGNKLHPILSQQEEIEMNEFSKNTFKGSVDRGEDSFWKLGLFYYNTNDPSLFVEDRFGNNGGVNLARTAGKIILISAGVFTVATYVFSTLLFISLM
jgi:uncharacterized membrane protein